MGKTRRFIPLRLAAGAVLALAAVFGAPAAQTLAAGPFTVNTTSDTHDSNTADGVCSDGTNCSLRAALEQANAAGGTTTINVPAGTYNLSLGALMAGTLPNTTITIHGAGAASTTINQSLAGRLVVNVNPNVNANVVFNLDNVTVTGGNENENDPDGFGGNGGAILAGGSASATGNAVSITNATFSGNYCSPVSNAGCSGGAINMTGGGNLTIAGSTFTGNTASKNRGFGAGGAIYFDNGGNGGNVSITNSTFTNNVAQGNSTTGGQGGAVRLAGGAGSIYAVTNNTFTGNAANGTAAAGAHGGALYLSLGTLTANFNRITGNTGADSAGLYVANNSGSVGDATNNWWGCNGGPTTAADGCDAALLGTPNQGGTATFSPWIVLSNAASPSAIQIGQTSTLSASFLRNSNNGALTTSQISTLIGLPVTWGNAQKGSLSSQQTAIQSNGTATATFTATACGSGGADATVDSGTASGAVTVQCPDLTGTKTNSVTGSAVVGQSWDWTITVANSGNAPASFATGQAVLSDNLPNASSLSYGTPSSSNASVACAINGTDDLACTASSAVTMAAGSSFTVTFSAVSTAPGTEANPRASATCAVDPSNVVVESNETNNACANTVTVSKADTTTAISLETPDPSVVGQAVTVNYSVTVNTPGAGTPTGNVTVSDGTVSCTNTVAAGSCQLTFTSAGAKSLTAQYAGDTSFNGSTSTATGHTVNAADTTTAITSDLSSPSLTGQAVTVNYSVTVNAPGAGTPTGNVTVSDGTVSCTNTVAAGSCQLTFTSAGTKSITATYAGDANFNTSSSAVVSHTVNQAAAITSAASATFTAGSAGSFSVTTSGFPTASLSASGALPSGVSFIDNGNGTATLAGTPAAGSGGVYALTITAHNGIGSDATQSFSLTVDQAASITSGTAASFTETQAGSFTVTTSGFPTASLSESGALPSGISFTDNGNGTAVFSGTPALGTAGTYPLTLTAHNGIGSDATQSFTLTVNAANRPPTIAVVAGGTCSSMTVQATDLLSIVDPDGDPMTVTASSNNQSVLPNKSVVLGTSGSNRTLTVTPVTKKTVGTAVVTVTVNDGHGHVVTLPITVIVGTSGGETLTGTSGADIIFGVNGTDTINAGDGNDLVCGGNGVDVIHAGNGDDTVDGQGANDVIYGDAGNDVLRGGSGNDQLYGGDGNDTLTGGSGADFFSGGAGTGDVATDYTPSQGDTTDGTIP